MDPPGIEPGRTKITSLPACDPTIMLCRLKLMNCLVFLSLEYHMIFAMYKIKYNTYLVFFFVNIPIYSLARREFENPREY